MREITLRVKFWRSVVNFAVSRLTQAVGPVEKAPVGIAGMRDPKFPCKGYAPERYHTIKEIATFRAFGWPCEGDGHYLCKKCLNYKPQTEESEVQDTMIRRNCYPVIEVTNKGTNLLSASIKTLYDGNVSSGCEK